MASRNVCRFLPRCGNSFLHLSSQTSNGLTVNTFVSSGSAPRTLLHHFYSPATLQVCLASSSTGTRGVGSVASANFTPGGGSETSENSEVETRVKQNLEKIRDRNFEEEIAHPEELKHFRTRAADYHDINTPIDPVSSVPPIGTAALPHPIWNDQELHSVRVTHKSPDGVVDRMAFWAVKLLRSSYDVISGYNRRVRNEDLWINRICFLETVAGVPGMVAAMVRHLHSLRRMRRDHGWIHTLLEEAENERMHLMTALQLKQPGLMFRGSVMVAQGAFVTMFSFAYLLSPRFCHRLVGYLEEEAVKTYSKLLKDMESGSMQHWNTTPAPELAVRYWALKPDANMKDVILAIRADEAHHRVVNHTLGSMKPTDYNPYKPGQ